MTAQFARPPLLRRSPRMLAGVCAGLAVHLGLPVRAVRIAMVVAGFVGGIGVLLYAWLWVFVPSEEDAVRDAERSAAGKKVSIAPPGNARPADARPANGRSANGRTANGALSATGRQVLAGAGLLALAGLVAAQAAGLPVQWGIVWPVVVAVAGAVIAWLQLDAGQREGLVRRAGADRAAGIARLVAGLALVVLGFVLLTTGAVPWATLWSGAVVALAVLAGVALVLLPLGLRFWRDYASERSSRIRAAERAEIAAHLHDSVLQTLALIQKRAGDESQVVRLARAQERELRLWLYADDEAPEGEIGEDIRAEAAALEESHDAVIDVVAVGSLTGLPGHDALLHAAREAMLNAVKHAGGTVSVYVEARPDGADVFVRDRGPGFDPETVGGDRLGVRESIVGRMSRNGGSAEIRSGPGGTEVRLHLPMQGENHHE